jgi:hypothetical protein
MTASLYQSGSDVLPARFMQVFSFSGVHHIINALQTSENEFQNLSHGINLGVRPAVGDAE